VTVTGDYFGNPTARGWAWQDLQGLGSGNRLLEYVVLSQNGVGDYNLREDSIKTLNDIKATVKLDLQAMFKTLLPFNVSGYVDLRDLGETAHLAMLSDNTLLRETVTEWFATYGLAEEINMLGYGGYETWTSRACAYPLDTVDAGYGLGFDFLANKYLTGLTIGLRYKYLTHQDLNYGIRNFDGYTFNLGATVTY
jgi:hypothetical protein